MTKLRHGDTEKPDRVPRTLLIDCIIGIGIPLTLPPGHEAPLTMRRRPRWERPTEPLIASLGRLCLFSPLTHRDLLVRMRERALIYPQHCSENSLFSLSSVLRHLTHSR
jgi:hypothetical protein